MHIKYEFIYIAKPHSIKQGNFEIYSESKFYFLTTNIHVCDGNTISMHRLLGIRGENWSCSRVLRDVFPENEGNLSRLVAHNRKCCLVICHASIFTWLVSPLKGFLLWQCPAFLYVCAEY